MPSAAPVPPPALVLGSAALDGTVIDNSPGVIVRVVACVADPPVASITLTVNANVPAVVGVPPSTPVDASSVIR